MTLPGRAANSFWTQRRRVVVRAGPNMVEREMFSDLASVIPQSGRMTAVGRKKQQTDRLDNRRRPQQSHPPRVLLPSQRHGVDRPGLWLARTCPS